METIIKTGKVKDPLPVSLVERKIAELTANPNVYHYIGLYSPTGWTQAARYLNQEGQNYKFVLVETPKSGFYILNPLNDSSINALFDPEDEQLKFNRAFAVIKELKELKAANRVVLIKDVAERCKLSEDIVLAAAREVALEQKNIQLEYISKSWVLYKK